MTSAGVDETNEPAIWGDPVSDGEIAVVEASLAAPIPAAWKELLQRDRWLTRGWLRSGEFVTFEPPNEAHSHMLAWDEALEAHPGFYWLGTDGSRLIYCVDLRNVDRGVMVTDIAAAGWHEADRLDLSVQEFVRRIDDGSFAPYPEADIS